MNPPTVSHQNDSMSDGKFYEFLLAAFKNMASHMAEGASASFMRILRGSTSARFQRGGPYQRRVHRVKNSLVLGSPTNGSMSQCCSAGCPTANTDGSPTGSRPPSGTSTSPSTAPSIHHEACAALAYLSRIALPNGVVLDLFGGSAPRSSPARRPTASAYDGAIPGRQRHRGRYHLAYPDGRSPCCVTDRSFLMMKLLCRQRHRSKRWRPEKKT